MLDLERISSLFSTYEVYGVLRWVYSDLLIPGDTNRGLVNYTVCIGFLIICAPMSLVYIYTLF